MRAPSPPCKQRRHLAWGFRPVSMSSVFPHPFDKSGTCSSWLNPTAPEEHIHQVNTLRSPGDQSLLHNSSLQLLAQSSTNITTDTCNQFLFKDFPSLQCSVLGAGGRDKKWGRNLLQEEPPHLHARTTCLQLLRTLPINIPATWLASCQLPPFVRMFPRRSNNSLNR